METVKCVASETLHGFLDSWRWLLVLHRLNKEADNGGGKGTNASSTSAARAEERAPMTSLELRRLQAKAAKAAAATEAAGSTLTPNPSKAASKQDSNKATASPKRKPSTQLLLCIAVNLGLGLGLWLCQYLMGLSVSLLGRREGGFRASLYWLASHTLHAVWVVPYYAVTRFVNVLWFQDIAKAALRQVANESKASSSSSSSSAASFSSGVSDLILAVVVETLFLLQASLVGFLVPIPLVGVVVEAVHVALLYSLYAFEYRWFWEGESLAGRLGRMETSWPYYTGFGASLALATSAADSLMLSGCLFGAAFPLLLIASIQAKPPPTPPLSASSSLHLPIFQPALQATSALSVKLHRMVARRQERLLAEARRKPLRR